MFAGLWDHWEKDAEHPLDSCAVITTDANSLVAPLHNRMPAIHRPEDYDLWLDPHTQNVQHWTAVLKPYSSEEMEAFPIHTLVNNPRYEDPRCIHPFGKLKK